MEVFCLHLSVIWAGDNAWTMNPHRLLIIPQVTLSSLNRHAVATREDVGSSKARCLEKHFKQIVPEVGMIVHGNK